MENSIAIPQHIETLKRLLALVFVYCGLADDTHQALRFIGKTATRWDALSGGGGGADGPARAFHAMANPYDISRRAHQLIRRLLFPMEAATRRLIIVLAAKVPNPKICPSDLKPGKRTISTVKLITLPRTWQGDVMVPRFLQPAAPPPLPPVFNPPARIPRFQLLDPLKRLGRRRYAGRAACPRISIAGGERRPIPIYTPQTPWDQLPVTPLLRRVTALAYALDDLPKQVQRYARWRALAAARRASGMRGRGKFFVPRVSRCAPASRPAHHRTAFPRMTTVRSTRSSSTCTVAPGTC